MMEEFTHFWLSSALGSLGCFLIWIIFGAPINAACRSCRLSVWKDARLGMITCCLLAVFSLAFASHWLLDWYVESILSTGIAGR